MWRNTSVGTEVFHSQNTTFMLMAILLATLAMGSIIMTAWLLPKADMVAIAALDTSIAGICTGVLTLFRVQESHSLMNSRFDEFKQSISEGMIARGREVERAYQEELRKVRLEAEAAATKERKAAEAEAVAKIKKTAQETRKVPGKRKR